MNGTEKVLKRILLVDPDEAFKTVLQRTLGNEYVISRVPRAEGAVDILTSDSPDVVLLNWDLHSISDHSESLSALRAFQEVEIPPPVLAFSGDTRRECAMEAMRSGVWDFFQRPLDVLALKFALGRAQSRMVLARELIQARELLSIQRIEGLIGSSKPMERVYEMIRKVAGVMTTVLITGESGTGKEVVARAIHRLSPRASKPFVAFTASALPETLIEDELFGHEKGAFTGASQARRGRFEESQGGTIFLDEIGDLAPALQVKLLRILQERVVERLGSNASRPLDIRVICATNRNLDRMVQEGAFRQDLYFRISVLEIDLPPLRSRTDDIPILAEYFMRAFACAHKKPIRGLTPGYLTALAAHTWPGNVRELQNVIERSVVLADGARLRVEDLPPELSGNVEPVDIPKGAFQDAVRSFKREMVRSALRQSNGNKLRAAQGLQISRCYLHRLLNQLKIGDDFGIEDELEATDALIPAAGPIEL